MKVPYKVHPDKFGSHTYSALLTVQLAGVGQHAMRTKKFEAVVDSGASRCLFHADLAAAIGLDLKSGQREDTFGIGGKEESYIHEVRLLVPDASGKPLTIQAGFKDKLPVAGLLGMNGFFEFYDIRFDPDAKVCEMTRIQRA